VNMTDKEWQNPHKQPASDDFGSAADRIASALLSAQIQTCVHVTGLPLAPLFAPMPPSSLYCAVTPIDDRGRLADRSPIRAVGWSSSQPVTISTTQESIVIVRAGGPEFITRQGHIRLPARIRHLCHLSSGDRVLVMVAPVLDLIVVYPMAVLEVILLQHHASGSAIEET
jgi:hypothetical protein